MQKKSFPFFHREISWLYFNERVLQEAADTTVPLIERLRFLAIFSSNLDEFYRVRITTLSKLVNINARAKAQLGYNPRKILNDIKTLVVKQERRFDHLFEDEILSGLAKEKIFILNDKQLNVSRGLFVRAHFRENILSTLVPVMIDKKNPFPELKDQVVYFVVRLSRNRMHKKSRYSLIQMPETISRFLVLPETNALKYLILLDDIIRYCLDDMFYMFDYDNIEAYSIQMTRDAELDLDQQVSEKFIDTLKKSLQKRKSGKPMRLLYDSSMPVDMLAFLVAELDLDSDGLIPGNRYPKFRDFIRFPNIGRRELEYTRDQPLPVKGLDASQSIINQVAKRDFLVNLPYQSFDYIIHFLREAAIDPKVTSIRITLYRLAENSRVINALINAAANGKQVYCFLELKARFDEQANIYWTTRLEEEGVIVDYGIADYKIHSKICLITRREKGKDVRYANLSTGNYNEKTASLYCDHSLFTADKNITTELEKLLSGLQRKEFYKGYKHLLVSPLEGRTKITALIDQEIANKQKGKEAYIILKMNSLADKEMVEKLYEASRAGVQIQLIVRGLCTLVPGVAGQSENIEAISIVDKYLEHARVYIFGNDGEEKIYLSSADLMTRNLDHRMEVGFPIVDHDVRREIRDIINIQLSDNTKARIIDAENTNSYRAKGKTSNRSQIDIYNYLKYK